MQGYNPGAAHVLAQGRVGRLQRIIPVAVAIGGQSSAGDDALFDHRERALHVLPQRLAFARLLTARLEEWQVFIQHTGIAGGNEILPEKQERPEDYIAVRIPGADGALAFEEHEPLRPIAVSVLRTHHA